MVLRGTREETRVEALRMLEGLEGERVAWIGSERGSRFVEAEKARALLGRAFDAVVIDLHDGLDADVIGQCHGLVWGGGCMVLRMPDAAPPQRALVTHPFEASDVGTRFWRRIERSLAQHELAPAEPIAPASREVRGTESQRAVVGRLARTFASDRPALVALVADRGRGKSSALGMALREAMGERPLRAVISAASPDAIAEVLRFAGEVQFVAPHELARGEGGHPDVIVVDEAAQLPVPLLQCLVRTHPRARIAFASTEHGYEGTGRGFALRFLAWAKREPRSLSVLELHEPIRWDAGDPLERLVFDALALDAEPAHDVGEVKDLSELEHVVFDRDALASDERMLRELFGLLVHAHYRTTPSDLHRLLDAPNVGVHALLHRGRVVAGTLVAHEGGLGIDVSERLARGEMRIRGHALADTLVCHSSRPEAGTLPMVRSVRIAVHPALRRRGLAGMLVDRVHRSYSPDLFGTLFGATPEVIRFRRSMGYELVRVGASRGARTGEPAAVMVRPVSARARKLVEELRVELARDLPLQLELLEGEHPLEAELKSALMAGLPAPPPMGEAEVRRVVASYLGGPRPYESAAFALGRFVSTHADVLHGLVASERALIEGRVLRCLPWARAAAEAGYPSVPAAMRALRRALRSFAVSVDSALVR